MTQGAEIKAADNARKSRAKQTAHAEHQAYLRHLHAIRSEQAELKAAFLRRQAERSAA